VDGAVAGGIDTPPLAKSIWGFFGIGAGFFGISTLFDPPQPAARQTRDAQMIDRMKTNLREVRVYG
jgi:hypothetical protein